MTLKEAQVCEQIAAVVCTYREHHNFIHSPCWLDEWALGYFCAFRDLALINQEQWQLLCLAFQPEISPS
jgi:hypothetical protein